LIGISVEAFMSHSRKTLGPHPEFGVIAMLNLRFCVCELAHVSR
jgi:hypothetical protein